MLSIVFNTFSYEIVNALYAHYSVDLPFIDRFTKSPSNVINLEEIQYSANVFSYLVVGIVPLSFNFIYGVLLTAGGKMKMLNGIAMVGIVFNLILNWVLIPDYGALGAAIASLVTQSVSALFQWYFCYKEHDISFPYLHFFKFIAIGAIMYFVSMQYKEYFDFPLAVISILGTGVILIFLLQLVSWKSVKKHLLKK